MKILETIWRKLFHVLSDIICVPFFSSIAKFFISVPSSFVIRVPIYSSTGKKSLLRVTFAFLFWIRYIIFAAWTKDGVVGGPFLYLFSPFHKSKVVMYLLNYSDFYSFISLKREKKNNRIRKFSKNSPPWVKLTINFSPFAFRIFRFFSLQ